MECVLTGYKTCEKYIEDCEVDQIEILVFVGKNHKKSYKNNLIRGIIHYANSRNIKYHLCDIDSLCAVSLDNVKMVFFPLNFVSWADEGDLKIFNILDDTIPLVFDVDMPIKRGVDLSRKKIALRSAFGEISSLTFTPEFYVPMLPAPLEKHSHETMENKDVIVVDAKSFHHAADTHFYVLSLMAHLAREWLVLEEIVGHKLYFYLTSFMKLSEYVNVFDALVKQNQFRNVDPATFSILADRLIEALPSHEDFNALKAKTRLFITEHGNLADADLMEALCMGTPVLTYKRFAFTRSSGIHHSSVNALKHLDKNIEQRIALAESLRMEEEYGLRNIITVSNVDGWDVAAYDKMFLKGYDVLFDWALNGKVLAEMHLSMKNSFFRNGIELDVKGFSGVSSSICVEKVK